MANKTAKKESNGTRIKATPKNYGRAPVKKTSRPYRARLGKNKAFSGIGRATPIPSAPSDGDTIGQEQILEMLQIALRKRAGGLSRASPAADATLFDQIGREMGRPMIAASARSDGSKP